jgi:RNA polymerase sigma-70 factor (ECF subfamily)
MKERVRQVFDEWLVLSYKSGNSRAMALLVRRWNPKLILHIYYRTNDLEVSKDIAQDCWIAILNGLPKLREPSDFGVWALRIANNKAVDWIRKQQKERIMLDYNHHHNLPDEMSGDEKDARLAAIREAYKQLDNRYRMLLNLHYRQGLGIRQMARILNISEGTVKSRLFKARSELKKKIMLKP